MAPLKRSFAVIGRTLKRVAAASSHAQQARIQQRASTTVTRGDQFGPPDPLSNVPQVSFSVHISSTDAERQYRRLRKHVYHFNHTFWSKQNQQFQSEKDAFLLGRRVDAAGPTADELATFYRSFLDAHYDEHRAYNWQWYRLNARLIGAELRWRLTDLCVRWLPTRFAPITTTTTSADQRSTRRAP